MKLLELNDEKEKETERLRNKTWLSERILAVAFFPSPKRQEKERKALRKDEFR